MNRFGLRQLKEKLLKRLTKGKEDKPPEAEKNAEEENVTVRKKEVEEKKTTVGKATS
jgi:hypothetical protein